MSCRERREKARRTFAARALRRYHKNVKTSAALGAKALGGDGVEFPEALVVVTAALRKMALRSVLRAERRWRRNKVP
jgi:hypothetical protein